MLSVLLLFLFALVLQDFLNLLKFFYACPRVGILADEYSYHLVFYIAGAFCLLAAVITFIIPFTQEEPSLPDDKDKEGANELMSATHESSI